MSAQRSQLAALLQGKKQTNKDGGVGPASGKDINEPRGSTLGALPGKDGGINAGGVDKQFFGMLTEQQDAPVPGLETYQANKQEMKLFREIEAKYRGALEENQKRVQVEEEREKELLMQLARIRQDNNDKRKRIEEMTGNVKNSGETVNQRRGVLTSIKNDYNR